MMDDTHPHGEVEDLVRFISLNILLDLHLSEQHLIELVKSEENDA